MWHFSSYTYNRAVPGFWQTAATLTLALLLAGCGGSGAAAPTLQPVHPGANLPAKLAVLQQHAGAPGLVALVREADGQVFSAAVGSADLSVGTQLDAGAQFFVGSVGKTFVATAVLRLAERGVLNLDAPLGTYLEWPRGDALTLRMLLAHRSGIPDYINEVLFNYTGGDLIEAYSRDWTAAEYAELVRNLPPHFAPDAAYGYSNSNFLLAGLVLGAATGKPLHAVLDDEVITPLGLAGTFLYSADTCQRWHSPVAGYSTDGWLRLWNQPESDGLHETGFLDYHALGTGDSSLVSTAADLLAFHVALREGRLLSADGLEQLRAFQPPEGYGLGYRQSIQSQGVFEGHSGRMLGSTTLSYFHPASGCYVIVMANLSRCDLSPALGWGFKAG